MLVCKQQIISLLSTGFILIFFLGTSGCDETFEPLVDNDRFFYSVYGFLDATSDTQWVRITPVREELYPTDEKIDAVVTLENLGTRESSVLSDSLFRYFHGGLAYNFWSSGLDLNPGETYQLTAQRSDGSASQAIIDIPPDYPTPYLLNQTYLIIEDVDNVADVRTVFHLTDDFSGQSWVVSFPQVYYHFAGRNFRAEINLARDFGFIDEFYSLDYIVDIQIFIAAAGPEWPRFNTLNPRVSELPNAVSNINNGVGYLAGVLSKTIPFEPCYNSSGTAIPCPLEPSPW